jgi:hypothetical protein
MKSDEETIMEFRKDLEKWARDNDLLLTNIKGWTEDKIQWMALNDRKCCCRPKERACPCKEGLEEARTSKGGLCLCSVFTTKGCAPKH